MLHQIYSEQAITKQITEQAHNFLLASENGKAIAFTEYALHNQPDTYKLHKLYALPDQPGKGFTKLLINYIAENVKGLGYTALQLNVNQYNKTKEFYEYLGFKVIYE